MKQIYLTAIGCAIVLVSLMVGAVSEDWTYALIVFITLLYLAIQIAMIVLFFRAADDIREIKRWVVWYFDYMTQDKDKKEE